MTRETTDILISGGGLAGLAAAIAFGQFGWRVICVDPSTPATDAAAEGADLRTTAFLQPSRDFLDKVGLWERLEPHATPLQVMRIVDAGGEEAVVRGMRDFDAAEISDAPFGWNLRNWLLRREMVALLSTMANVELRAGTGTKTVLTREGEALVTLTDGSRLAASLLIAADGRYSPVRQALGIGARTLRYGQKALAFAVTHPIPHENVSTEIHRTGGPFTLVPLPDRDGKPSSAVVWMERGPEAQRLAALPQAAFEAEMTGRSCSMFGPLTLASRRSLWPIISQIADRFTGQRTALVAESAHVVPPIGAQGLNMSLSDLDCLLDLASKTPGGLGSRKMLDQYDRKRHPEALARVTGIDLLNRASMAGSPILRDLRGAALGALHSTPPIRRILMKAGLG